jgi:RNA polymerase sigma factor (sigma-70 family)
MQVVHPEIKSIMRFVLNSTACAWSTDTALWLNFREGDKQAFAALYHRYCSIMANICLRISPDGEIIKDCIHDLFAEMWKNRARLALPVSVKAYLVRSVQRKIIRQLKRRRLDLYACPVEALHEVSAVSSVEKVIIAGQLRQEQQENIRRAIRVLTRRQREAVYLKFYVDLSYPEIARKMCISTDAIYNLISKAIGNMQETFSKTNFPTL